MEKILSSKQDNDEIGREAARFFGLSREMSAVFWQIGKVQKFKHLEELCRIGDKASFFGFILKGKVAVLDNYGAALGRIEKGDIFGELSFVLGSSRTADLVGVGNGSFLRVDFERVSEIYSSDPELRSQLFQLLALKIARRFTMHKHDKRQYIALVAHNQKKDLLAEFVSLHREILSQFDLIATATTARFLLENADMSVSRSVSSGPLGGDMAIGSLITTGNIKGIIFFKDPLVAHPHQPDIEALSRMCDVYDVPLATNMASAELLLKGLFGREMKG